MDAWFSWLPHWLEWIEPWLPWLTLASLLVAIASMIAIPVLIVNLPEDYFSYVKRKRYWTLSRVLLYAFRNALALTFLLAGVAMLVLPGQGLLTILIAVMVSDVPGKYRLEVYLLNKRRVLKAINWLRARYSKPPLEVNSLQRLKSLNKSRKN